MTKYLNEKPKDPVFKGIFEPTEKIVPAPFCIWKKVCAYRNAFAHMHARTRELQYRHEHAPRPCLKNCPLGSL
jgi:hypothetical protein